MPKPSEVPLGKLYRRGRRWWWRFYDHGRRHQAPCRPAGSREATTDKAVARQIVRDILRHRRGQAPAGATWQTRLVRFAAVCCAEATPAHGVQNSSIVQRFLTATGIPDPASFTLAAVQDYLAALSASGLAPATVANHRSALGRFAEFLIGRDELEVNPVRRTKPPRIANILPRFLTRRQAGQVLRSARRLDRLHLHRPAYEPAGALDGQAYNAIAFCLYSGLRLSELRALRWGDVTEAALLIGSRQATKGNRPRAVPIGRRLQRLIAKRLHRGQPAEYVFPVALRESYGRAMRKLTALHPDLFHEGMPAKCPGRGWHLLRHTFCSWLAQAGVPLARIQAWAGHSDIRTTMRYSHLAPGDREGIDRL